MKISSDSNEKGAPPGAVAAVVTTYTIFALIYSQIYYIINILSIIKHQKYEYIDLLSIYTLFCSTILLFK